VRYPLARFQGRRALVVMSRRNPTPHPTEGVGRSSTVAGRMPLPKQRSGSSRAKRL